MTIPSKQDIGQVLAITDALGIHREAVRIPLDVTPGGRATVEGGKLVVTLPLPAEVESFLLALPSRIAAVPGRDALRSADS